MRADEIRSKFLDFFKGKGHLVHSSSPLAAEDPELLFTIAGMVPFKAFFLGKKKPPASRITSCQLCLRTNDLEKVGQTCYHHTFFEMLGNFSFGDYFKNEACEWALEFVNRELGIPFDRLWITIFREDDETALIWKKLGFSSSRIIRKGEEDNFWAAGEIGPCGPDTEIFFDRGEKMGCVQGCEPGCNRCSRWVEIWNLVFIQYNRDASGKLFPLPSKNVDTGMGLERVATVLQGVSDDYHTDLFYPLYQWLKEISPLEQHDEKALRVISDHLRGLTFLIEEEILPSNVGRGYVVRRLLRRAARYGRRLGLKEPFLYRGVPVVVRIMGKPYPGIEKKQKEIAKIIKMEEESFQNTLSRGLSILEEMIKELKADGDKILPGEKAFRMYDTYGFPLELTREILLEAGLSLDEEGFQRFMEKQREMARASSVGRVAAGYASSFIKEIEGKCPSGKGGVFVGYDTLSTDSDLLAIVKDNKLVDRMEEGEEGEIVVSETPFYPEGGGQVADKGKIFSSSTVGEVVDVAREGNLIFHRVKVQKGQFKKGDSVRLEVDKKRRVAVARSHTATHLLHAALRAVLGEEIKQSGSLVDEERLRFDFTCPFTPGEDKLRQILLMVNQKIREDIPVEVRKMSLQEARRAGAIALFEEKYEDKVRVVKVGDFSMEVCGGCHLSRTGQMGLFEIISESGIASGVRRIEALCGERALLWLVEKRDKLRKLTEFLAVPEDKIADRLKDKEKEVASLKSRLKKMQESLLESKIQELTTRATDIEGIKVCAEKVEGISPSLVRKAAEELRDRLKQAVVALVSLDEERVFIIVASTRKDLPANQLIKEVCSLTGGSGGGRWDFAQGGTSHPEKIDEALQKFPEIIKKMIKGAG